MRIILPVFILLAACATPRETCISNATDELQVIDGLIATTQANIQRGYAIQRDLEPTLRLRFCASPSDNFHFCNTRTTKVVERPVAIDVGAENAKLKSLKQRRTALDTQARRDIATCQAQHPEG